LQTYLQGTLRPSRYNTSSFLQVFDVTDSEKPILLYQPDWIHRHQTHSENIKEILPEIPVTLELGGRQWRIALYRISSFFDFEHWYSFSILCFGIIFTLGLWRYLSFTLHRANWAEDLVKQRTYSLEATNDALQQEMENTRNMTKQLDASRRQFRAIFDEAGIGIIQTDLKGIILENNKAVQAIIGYSNTELQGRSLMDFVHPSDNKVDHTLLSDLLNGHYDSYRIGKRFLCRNGETVWTHLNCSIVRDPNHPFLISMIEDVTERHFAEIARLEAEKKYRKIFENAIEGIFQCTIMGHFLSVNPAFLKIFACADAKMLYENHTNLKQTLYEDPKRYEEFMHLLASQREVQNFEYRARCFDGRVIWVAETVRMVTDNSSDISFYEGFIEDITDRKAAEDQLRYDATHDQLTGLLNRAAFTRHLERALARLHQTGLQPERGLPFVVLFVDLDRFKIINDSMGHLVGDQLLEEIAHRLRKETRDYDIVARFGGDEFALMLENLTSIKALELFIDRLTRYLSEPYIMKEETFNTSASIGVAIASQDYVTADEILRDADIAMYEAKKQGRGKAVFFQPGMHLQVLNIMRMESDLRKAFEREEFCLYYQPIISLENNYTVSLEALLRWNHPEKGLISPDHFIPLAEDTGMIRELGLWVFEQACRQLNKWQTSIPHHKNLGMNINVSPIQLKQPRLVCEIQDIIARTGVNPNSCRMEITESAMMHDPDLMLNVLHDLKGLKVQLYIDDFGTGYSSLSYLQKFPIDALKIDKSFIQNIDASNKSMQIAQAIIALGNAFDLRVVAEGVETRSQVDILHAAKCHHVQGYYFSRPTDQASTENYLNIQVH
jgi:diguanylate cyclase (GGDEF)-like protein/PAS domain S-box-containing protein